MFRGLLALAVWPAGAQHHAGAEKPAVLLPGAARRHHPIATRSPEAQQFFDQGLAMLYGFNRMEAVRSFRRAAELDPAAAMPWWGLAMAFSQHINMDSDGDVSYAQAHAAIEKARALAAGGPAEERDYVEAAAARTSRDPQPDAARLALAYKDAMRGLWQKYPYDLDAGALYAEALMIPDRWKWWTPDGRPSAFTEEAVAVLEQVLRRNPDHPGANHFMVHATEQAPDKERCIPAAMRLMTQPPATGHLVHMAGHIFLQTGDFDLAARSNEHAVQMDRGYMDLTGVWSSVYSLGYHPHNIHFIVVARMAQGRFEDAWRAALELEKAGLPGVNFMPEMADYFVPNPLFVLVRFGKWDEILKLPEPHEKLPVTRALHQFGRALALQAKARRAEAQAGRERFEAFRKGLPAAYPFGTTNTAADLLTVAAEVLAARLAAGPQIAVQHWRQAVAAQDALAYDEPSPWFYPVRESLGAALLRASRPAEAEAVFREALARHPRQGRLLFGLLESLTAQNKTAQARLVQPEFEAAWKNATVKLRLEDL